MFIFSLIFRLLTAGGPCAAPPGGAASPVGKLSFHQVQLPRIVRFPGVRDLSR